MYRQHTHYIRTQGIYLYIIFSIILLTALPAGAQTFRQVSTSDRLVNAIHRDATGYVWIGTGQTVDRYDGVRVKKYTIPGERLNLKRVTDITSGRDGTVYIANGEGVFRLPAGGSDIIPMARNRINFPVNGLLLQGDTLFAATDQGVYLLSGDERHVERFMPRSDVLSANNVIKSLQPDPASSDALWLASRSSLMYLNLKERIFTEYPNASVNAEFTDMARIGNILYIATRGEGVLTFDISSRAWGQAINAGCNLVSAISVDPDEGMLNIATDGDGVYIYSTRRGAMANHLTHERLAPQGESLSSNSVYSIETDSEGLLWIGYYQSGLDYTPEASRIFDIFSYSNYFDTSQMTVRAVAINGDEMLIGTREGLYYLNRENGLTASFATPAIRSNIIFATTYNPADHLYYIGTYGGGMYTFNPATLSISRFNPVGPAFENTNVFVITPDSNGDMWVGSSLGAYSFRDGKLKDSYTYANSRLPRGEVFEIFFDSAGRGWFCTENGMAVLQDGALRADNFPKGFVNNQKIRDIYEDGEHNLYFVPDRGDVVKSDLALTRFSPLPLSAGGRVPTVTFITEDTDRNLWIGTDDGLIQYDRDKEVRHFSASDGIPSPVFTFCPPIRDDKGDLWMGCTGGLVHLDYENFKTNAKTQRVPRITDVVAGGHSMMGSLKGSARHPVLSLNSNNRSFTIYFSDLGYTSDERHKYEYKLDGYDDEWIMAEADPSATYYDIPTGRYTFKVRQAGSPSTESRMDVRMSHVFSTFEWVLIAIALIAVAVAVYLYIRHRRILAGIAQGEYAAMYDSADDEALGKTADASAGGEDTKYRTTRLSDVECRRVLRKLDAIMRTERPFTNPDLKVSDLATMIGYNTHALSYTFNQYLKTNYYDYVNEHRVKAFKEMLEKDPNLVKYTISAMSAKCGFSSRASFFRYFKKFTGSTPAEYLKSLKKL
ncbi:MAG: helix-turn-helix domain-containing protein [Paenibacillus sp.]|nr:helix-turn-helix domain-containing protein [Paenibacillus sp.]